MKSTNTLRRGSTGRFRIGALALLAVGGMLAAACSTAPVVTPGQAMGVGQRTISLEMSGAETYSRSATVSGGRVGVTYNSGSGVTQLAGTVEYPGAAGGTATATFNLTESLGTYSGPITVVDPSVGVSRTVSHSLSALSFDGDGDSSGVASSGGATLSWELDTVATPGIEPELDTLSAAEATFCQEAQRDLVGLDESTLPAASILNTVHPSRAVFGGSKAVFSPLAVQTWSEIDMAQTADGNTVAISHRISCKTRSSDHLVTVPLPVAPDAQCSTLTERSMELARAEMTQPERDAYDATGKQLDLQADRQAGTGNDYLTPFVDESDNGSELEVTAGSLLVSWSDPANQILSPEIRGVHYCTVWAPTWAYWWMTEGAFV
ncbi:MAG: hypothetical protein ACR2OH_13880 [Microthrixaceae bacterium]